MLCGMTVFYTTVLEPRRRYRSTVFDPLLPFARIYPNSGSKTVVPDLLVSQGANARNGCEPGTTKVWVSERFFRTGFRAALGWQFKA